MPKCERWALARSSQCKRRTSECSFHITGDESAIHKSVNDRTVAHDFTTHCARMLGNEKNCILIGSTSSAWDQEMGMIWYCLDPFGNIPRVKEKLSYTVSSHCTRHGLDHTSQKWNTNLTSSIIMGHTHTHCQNPGNGYSFVYDNDSVTLTHAIPQHQTLRKMQSLFLENPSIILHDSARKHVADVMKLFTQWGWEVLYSPDLSPCYFDLIPKMKEPLCGILFRIIPDILHAVHCSIWTIN